MNYIEQISSIDEMIRSLPKSMESEEKKFLSKTGSAIKSNVVKYLHRSGIEYRLDIDPKNYDGSRPYVHIKDDVKFTVRRNKLGDLYVSVKGGKYTGYKWGFLNDGHIAKDGKTFVPGTKFIERALQASQGDISNELHEIMKKVTE